MIIDIRDNKGEEVTGIRFDDSDDYINLDVNMGFNTYDASSPVVLCSINEIDNLIKALQKAKELWG